MNLRPLLFAAFTAVAFSGCATFNKAELGVIQRSGVSPRIVTKMEDGRAVAPEDVIELTRRRVPDTYILRQIDDVGVDYVLSPEDFAKLKKAGVSPPVVDALVSASNDFAQRYAMPRYDPYAYDPLLGPYPYPYYDGYYGPRRYYGPVRGSVGIGISTSRYRRWDRHH